MPPVLIMGRACQVFGRGGYWNEGDRGGNGFLGQGRFLEGGAEVECFQGDGG
jgi:hypothetical protein